MLSPAAHERCTYSSRGKDEDNRLFVVCHIFTVQSQPQSQQIRATEAFHLSETEGSLLFVRHWEVVFQTRDYAHCDLPKHTVLAIFS